MTLSSIAGSFCSPKRKTKPGPSSPRSNTQLVSISTAPIFSAASTRKCPPETCPSANAPNTRLLSPTSSSASAFSLETQKTPLTSTAKDSTSV